MSSEVRRKTTAQRHLSWILRLRKSSMVRLNDIQNARSLLHNVAVRTPLVLCKLPDDRQIFIKPENLQPIGSFKLRGAYNKISSLTAEERKRGVVAHSSGNHAQGVAFAARALGVKATIVMPSTAPQGEAGRDTRAGSGDSVGGAGQRRSHQKSRGTGKRTRVGSGAAVQRRENHRRAGDNRAGNS